MKNQGTQLLQTPRLILRKFTEADGFAMYENWAKDPKVTEFLTWTPHSSPEASRAVLGEWVKCYEDETYYQWCIEYEGTPIGSICVVRLDERSEWAELGYCLGYDFWGKGLMTEAAKAVVDFLFSQVGVNRICIEHAVKNLASGRVAEKCGLQYEGTKRAAFRSASGEFLDISFRSILRSEYTKNHG